MAVATSPVVAATESEPGDDVQLLEGRAKVELARDVAETAAFERLAAHASGRGEQVSFDADHLRAGRADTTDLSHEVVEYQLRGVEGAAYASIIVGRGLDGGAVNFAWLDYYHEADDGVLTEVQRLEAPAGGVGALSTNTIDVNDRAIRQVRESDSIEDVGLQPNWECAGCEYAVGTVCTTACGGAGGFVCGFFGITIPIAGLSCLGFVTIVCDVADYYSGCGAAIADEVCDDQLGVC